MKQTVRLQRGLYVLMDSYSRPNFISYFKSALPALFCIGSIAFATITLQLIEQRSINACSPTAHRAN